MIVVRYKITIPKFRQFNQNKKIETKNILMKEKNFKDLVTYFTMKEKEYLMIDNYLVELSLVNIEDVIDIEKFDDTKIFIETDDKLKDDVALKNVVILIT